MSGKPYFTWMPWQLQFVMAHCGTDMTPREIAIHFGCTEDRVHEAIRTLKIRRTLTHLTSIHSPVRQGDRHIGSSVRMATRADGYIPMTWPEFRVRYPDGLRPE